MPRICRHPSPRGPETGLNASVGRNYHVLGVGEFRALLNQMAGRRLEKLRGPCAGRTV